MEPMARMAQQVPLVPKAQPMALTVPQALPALKARLEPMVPKACRVSRV